MKKLIAASLAVVLGLASCDFFSDGLSDEEEIRNVIDDLESSINSRTFAKFKNCFHSDCTLYSTYTTTQFNTDFPNPTVYDFRSVNVNSSNDVTCTAYVNGTGYSTSFNMEKDDGNWKIYVWTEDGTTMFYNMLPSE